MNRRDDARRLGHLSKLFYQQGYRLVFEQIDNSAESRWRASYFPLKSNGETVAPNFDGATRRQAAERAWTEFSTIR